MTDNPRAVIASQVQEILNYFGKCPVCGQPAAARRITAQFADGRVVSEDIAECFGYCGWKGAADSSVLTGTVAVLSHGQNTIHDDGFALPAP